MQVVWTFTTLRFVGFFLKQLTGQHFDTNETSSGERDTNLETVDWDVTVVDWRLWSGVVKELWFSVLPDGKLERLDKTSERIHQLIMGKIVNRTQKKNSVN